MEDYNLDVKQLFFNNLQLLGFDVVAMEATNHIPFNKNMFELSNKRGAEIVLHFLFERLNPTMSREAFRDVWPILDKKREQAFRKTCANWLGNIAKEEPESHLPRINASLFMSPGGDKFYDLLMCFSGHVLMKVMDSELVCAYSKPVERLRFPTLTPSNIHLGDVMVKEFASSSIRHRKNFFDVAQLTLKAGGTWKDTADEFVKEFRKLNKEIRELDYNMREEEQRSVENSLNRGSPTKKFGKLDNLDPTFDPRIIQRAQRVQQVREMWKQLDDFERTEAAEREIVESIVERTINKYKIDASEIGVQVPDMLLRECGEEIRRRNVANTYQGGKLNLESVLQLWNLCLHLYLEKLKQVGMPQFNDDVKKLTSQVHVQQNYLQSARTLRSQMNEKIPVLKESIDKLREGLDENMFKDKSPASIRSTSLGFGLVEPSPQPNFSPRAVITPTQPLEVPRFSGYVDTPEAASQIGEEMRASVVQGPKQLFTDDVDLLSQQRPKDSVIPRLGPTKGPSQTSSRQSSRPTSARSTSSKGSKRSNQSSARPVQDTKHQRDREPVFPTVSSPRTMVEKSYKDDKNLDLSTDSIPLSARSNISSTGRLDRSGNSSSTAKASQSPRSLKSNSPGGLSARSHDSVRGGQHGRKTPTDLLVDEIMGEGKILSPFNSGLEAFESRVLVNRTPELEEGNKENMEPDGGDTNVLRDTPDDEPVDEDQMDMSDIYPNKGRQLGDYGAGGMEIEEILGPVLDEEILGPVLDEEYDNNDGLSDGSHHSEGPVVVIDRSLHLSPKHTPEKQQRSNDTNFIDDETFPSLETSPREAIVIDHSFHKSPISKDNTRNRNHNNSIPEFLSQSYQGQTVDSDQVKKDLLSKSLLLERSPLMDEIREMFQKAVAETPPRGQSLTNQQPNTRGYRRQIDTSAQRTDGFVDRMDDDDDVLDLPDMDINSRHSGLTTRPCVRANTSWEMTENLDDIQMPDFNEPPGLDHAGDNDGDNDDVDYNDSADHDRDLSKESEGSDKDTEENGGFSIPGVVEIDDIDDFFRTKTPELPSRNQDKRMRSPGMDGTDRSVDIPEFPDYSMEEELPLISFTS